MQSWTDRGRASGLRRGLLDCPIDCLLILGAINGCNEASGDNTMSNVNNYNVVGTGSLMDMALIAGYLIGVEAISNAFISGPMVVLGSGNNHFLTLKDNSGSDCGALTIVLSSRNYHVHTENHNKLLKHIDIFYIRGCSARLTQASMTKNPGDDRELGSFISENYYDRLLIGD